MGLISVFFLVEKFNEFKRLEDVSRIHEGNKRRIRILLDTESQA